MSYHYYIGPWVWSEKDCWRMPDNAVSGIDLRAMSDISLRNKYGQWPHSLFWFTENQNLGIDYKLLGVGYITEIRPTDTAAWESMFGSAPIGETLMDWLVNKLTDNGTPTGEEPAKILTPTAQGFCEIWLIGHSLKMKRKFVWNPDERYCNLYRDLQRAELKEIEKNAKVEAKLFKDKAKDLRRENKHSDADKVDVIANKWETLPNRFLGWLTKQHFGSFNDPRHKEFYSPGLDLEPLTPETAISDTFDSGLGNWTNIQGTWTTESSQIKNTGAFHSHIRHNTAMSGQAHWMSADSISGSGAYASCGAETRVSSGAYSGYSFQGTILTEGTSWLRKYSDANTFTSLLSPGSATYGNYKLQSNGSSHTVFFNSVQQGSPYTDTSYTSLSLGLFSYSTMYQDNASGADISNSIGLAFGRGGAAFNGGRISGGRTIR